MPSEHRETAATTIAAPLDVVWDLVTDIARFPDWIESTLEIVHVDGGIALGASYVERSRISGFFTSTICWRVAQYEPRRRVEYTGSGVSVLSRLGYSVEIEPVGSATEFTLELWYLPRFGPLGSFMEVAARSNVNAEHRRSVATFSILAERRASGDAL
jgi:hypothetical protein